jgi:hypothetical protein
MRRIELGGDKQLSAMIDDADFDLIWQFSVYWFPVVSRYSIYARAKAPWRVPGSIERYSMNMHTLIMRPPPGFIVDHEDKDGLNNQRYNLRVVTDLENRRNKRRYNNNTSGINGVYSILRGNGLKWRAQITMNKIQTHLGEFNSKEQAILARLKAELEMGFHSIGDSRDPNG